ncbi:unnamed protein product [Closterium sp. Yama58-4]|nr:unnamed protein product [Closterium sp. Yama58-4]
MLIASHAGRTITLALAEGSRLRAATGVHGLLELMAPVGQGVSVEAIVNKTLAIDASIWVVQLLKAMHDDREEMLPGTHCRDYLLDLERPTKIPSPVE